MSYNEAQKKATIKYMRENLEEIRFRVKKGRKNEIRMHANSQGESLASFISRAIAETIDRDNTCNPDGE